MTKLSTVPERPEAGKSRSPREETVERATLYMTEIVDPTINDFEANPTSRRHAFLACVVTYHCVDYLTHPKHPGNLRKDFQNSKAFAVIDRVAHAFKHVTGGDENNKQIPLLEGTHVVMRPPACAGVMAAGLSGAGDAVGGVTIWNEPHYDLLTIVKEAAKFLRGKISLKANR